MKHVSRNAMWLIALGVMTIVLGVVYVVVQQTLRFAANEPQRAMAQDAAYIVEHGGKPSEWDKARIDMGLSMAPFIILYDENGNVVSGNGYLDGEIPKVPNGVLQTAAKSGEDTVTWAPRKDVRIASVTVPAGGYFVLSGRSLAVVENQLAGFIQWLATVWAVTLIAIAVAFLVSTLRKSFA